MQRPRGNRELQVFSASAIDLFASTLGAFIVIAMAVLPDYQKTEELEQLAENLQEDLAAKNEKLAEIIENQKVALLGIETEAKSFAIVIDLSGSMQNFTQTAQSMLDRLIDAMNEDAEIVLYGYRGDGPPQPTHRWPARGLTGMSGSARNDAKSRVSLFLSDVGGGTPTLAAMQTAMNEPVEAIILVTDGAPNTNADQVVDTVTAINRGSKEIHAVGVGPYWDQPVLLRFLIGLTKNNGGELVAATQTQ